MFRLLNPRKLINFCECPKGFGFMLKFPCIILGFVSQI